ncbi:MAG: S1 family peptidase [Dehalococcoidia bacterium]|nr:S1 family peptidase [Dehalococcoidia bacterium]
MSLKRKISFMAMLIVIIIISVASVPIALGAQSDNSTPSNNLNEAEALLFDAGVYAKIHGVTVDEAIHRFKLQDVARGLETDLSNKEADTFAGLWIEHTPEFRIVVAFTYDGKEKIRPYIKENLVDVIEVRTAKISLTGLQNAQAAVLSSFRDLGVLADTAVDVRENRVIVHVVDRNQIENYLQNGKLTLPDCIELVTVKELAKPCVDIYGGLTLNACTSGFAVKKPDGTKGITTAAHCDNFEFYCGIPLPMQQERKETYYDIQWHTAPLLTVKNKIQWSSAGYTRDITATRSRDSQLIGELVYKYGCVTYYTAGHIVSKTATLSYIPNCQPTFICVDNDAGYNPLVSLGDSGGPWWVATTAYGTTCARDATGDGYYMAVNYFSGIGVSVMTSP